MARMFIIKWLVKNRIYILSTAGQPQRERQRSIACEKNENTYPLSQDHGENVNFQWLMENRIHVPSKRGQPRQERQHSKIYEILNSRTI